MAGPPSNPPGSPEVTHTLEGLVTEYSPPLVDRIWVYGDLIIKYPKPYSIYLRGTIYSGDAESF